MSQETPGACIVDTTPPTFAGISSAVAQPNGSLLASWLAASDLTLPITYEIFIKPITATDLFLPENMCLQTRNLSAFIFIDGNANILVNETYFVGVRARDGVGNVETNTVSLSAVSLGVLPDAFSEIANNLINANKAIIADYQIVGIVEDGFELVGVIEEN
jgi:hypothetical protein